MRHTILVIYYLGKILNFFTFDLNIFLKNKRKFLSVVKNRIKFRVNIFMEQEKKNKKNKSFKNPKFYPPPRWFHSVDQVYRVVVGGSAIVNY